MSDANRIPAAPVGITVKSRGKAINDTISVLSISVRHALNSVSTSTIRVADGDIASEEFNISASPVFVPGENLSIEAGYGDRAYRVIFKGLIKTQNIRVKTEEGSTLIINSESITQPSGTDPDGDRDAPVMTVEYGYNLIDCDLTLDADKNIIGIVKILGAGDVQLEDMIALKGINARFNGNHRVVGILHELSEGQWIETLTLGD